jgi:uncharacterized membrane protein YhhN
VPFVLAFAVLDWIAVATGTKRADYFFKPATLGALIAVASVMDAPDTVIMALAFSLFGDVFLMLPRDLFIFGLASFLIAHLFYVWAFWPLPVGWPLVAAVVAAVALPLYIRINKGLGERHLTKLSIPVGIYVLALGAMVVAAGSRIFIDGRGTAFAVGGAALFMCSDALIGWTRFVKPFTWGPLAIIVTYHLAQMGLVWYLIDNSSHLV